MAEETKLSASLSQLNQIEALKGTSNHQQWKRLMQDFLEMLDLWHYIDTEKTVPVVRPATAAVTATNNRAGAPAVPAVIEADIVSWSRAHRKICTMMRTRCEDNPCDKIEGYTNAAEAWEKLNDYKPRGSGILNSTILKLESLTLTLCKGKPQSYADRFIGVLREFKNQPGKNPCTQDENWKIYHFHKGLGSQYNAYCEQYNQNHDAYDNKGKAKFTLDYAMTRFLNTVINPTDSTMSDAHALAAIVGGSLGHTQGSVIALVATGAPAIEHRIQIGATSSNSRTFTQTCKYCTICKKDWHSNAKHNEHKRKRDDEDQGSRSRGDRGDHGG